MTGGPQTAATIVQYRAAMALGAHRLVRCLAQANPVGASGRRGLGQTPREKPAGVSRRMLPGRKPRERPAGAARRMPPGRMVAKVEEPTCP